nr:immunoglobulin light chain junction region [Macaca mulatta]MOX69293.1 immunoglobulin light chain junction region [Macaca mulatta]MOX69477.1 immunoglobulin light chain junction region [Macaca mulatta]MOX69773.1 immunoglobulin light chain junction region [Macaca mulatta]MOX69833.1 immunoglobulin light chain junction region [Macaca mulatta]
DYHCLIWHDNAGLF